MRISLLLQREPFGAIFEETLSKFLGSWTGRPHEVYWYDGRPNVGAIRRRGQQPWLCNIYLNAIFVPEASPDIFDPIRREFARSVVWWRRPAQRAYVALATSRLGARWLAQASVGISPPLPDAEHLLIVAGNHKIRLLDQANGAVYGILKNGFPPGFMQREIEARQQAEKLGLPVPPLEAVAGDGTWFRERYVSGTPVNRLADLARAQQAVADVARALHHLLDQTQQEEFLEDYVERLRTRIEELLRVNHLLSSSEKQFLLKNTGVIVQEIGGLRSAVGGRVTTALTYGDFQPANVLVNNDGTWLIDWEYSARRQAGYDALVFALRGRFPKGLPERLRRLMRGDVCDSIVDMEWTGLSLACVERRRLHVLLFLLEEVILGLQENANPLFGSLSSGFFEFQRSLRYSLREVVVA